MGEWYDIKMRFENRQNVSMSDLLIQAGIAEIINEDEYGRAIDCIRIDIKKLNEDFYNEINKDAIENNKPPKEYFTINYKENYTDTEYGLQYFSKWGLDSTILMAISKYFKDDVIYTNATYSGGGDFRSFFVKDGEFCLRDGSKIDNILPRVNPNLVKEQPDGKIKVFLPIGEDDNDKWGTFEITKNNVEIVKFENWEGKMVTLPSTILLKGNITVDFKNENKIYTPDELREAYSASKSSYRTIMQENVYIKGLSLDKLKKMGDEDNTYYIVNLPCKRKVSSNEKISFTVNENSIENIDNPNEMSIYIGQFGGTPKNVRIQDENGYIVQTTMKPGDIKKYYEETLSPSQLESINGNTNEEVDDDLER